MYKAKQGLNLMRTSFICTIGLLVLTGCMSTSTATKTLSPNIIFIYTDDQAPWALGISGQSQAHTPNLDALASQGMYFPNSYTTTPVCSPSRAGLMTSRYGYELGINDWINVKAKTLSEHQPDLGLEEVWVTWPEILQTTGYRTGLIGKWHLGYQDRHHPTRHGYDEFVGFIAGGTSPINPILEVNETEQREKGLTVDILTNYAIDFIERHKDEKFALSLHYRAPHHRFLPVKPEDEAPYSDIEIALPEPDYPNLNKVRATKLMREYLSSVTGIDRNVGYLLEALDALGLSEDTVVIFTSDHGYNIGHNGIWHKGNGFWLLNEKTQATANIPSGQRPNLYDNSLKVPAIVRWPQIITPNSVNPSTLSNLDWFPTLVEIAGAEVNGNNNTRGNSYVEAFKSPSTIISSDYFAAYSTEHQSLTQMRMYSDGQFKLVLDFLNRDRGELYDLTADPAEKNNLYQMEDKRLQDIKARLKKSMLEKMQETNDPVLRLQEH